MVSAGALVVSKFHGVLVVFALILLYQGFKITCVGEDDDDDDGDLEDNKVVKVARCVPTTHRSLCCTPFPPIAST
jgi:hypothetical protein